MGAGVSAERIKSLFDKLDKDGDGFLNIDELAPVAETCGVNEKDFQEAFDKSDKTKDGLLDLKETTKIMKALKITEEQFKAVEAAITTVLLMIPNTTIVTMKGTQGKDRKVLGKGDLSVLSIQKDKVVLTMGKKFVYALSKKLPTVRIARVFYCLPGPEEGLFYGLLMPSTTDDSELESLDVVLSQNTTFRGFYSAPETKTTTPESAGAAVAATGASAIGKMGSMLSAWNKKAQKAIEDVKKSESYKKASEAAQKNMEKIAESEAFKKAKETATTKYNELKESENFKKAQEMALKGKELAVEKFEEGKAYAKKIVESQRGKSVGDKVACGVGVATDAAVAGIGITAKFAGATVRETVKILKKTMKPADKERQVGEKTKQYVKTAAKYSGKAVVVSKHVASTALAVADALSTKLTEAIEGSQMYQDNKEKLDHSAAQDAKKVIKAGIEGSFKVIDAMIDAGLLLVAEVTVGAADVAEHTQGKQVGEVAKDAGEIVSNAARAGANLRHVGLAPMAKRAILGTTVDMLGTEEEKKEARALKGDNQVGSLAVTLVAAQAQNMK